MFGIAAASRNTRFQAARYGFTWAGLAPADRASFGWRLLILTTSTPATVIFQRETRTIPIVFANGADPVASGVVPRLNQPDGNITGFANRRPSGWRLFNGCGGSASR